MSEENVQLVRRLYEDGLFDGDPERLVAEFAAPEVEYVNPPEAVEPGVRRGAAEVVQAMRSSSEMFDSSWHVLRELHDCGDAVVATVSFCARSQGSGAELVQEEAHTWTWRNGRVVRFEWGRDPEAALEAARAQDHAG
jgi:ketosteroid isomerase-like protein